MKKKTSEIIPDKQNFRIHNDRNKKIIEKSLKDFGAGRSILIDSQNEIIAGNGVFEAAKKQNIKTRIIETDGTELLVVKRTDLNPGDEKRKQLALIDNHSSDISEFDFDLIVQNFDNKFLQDFDLTIPDFKNNIDFDNIKSNEDRVSPDKKNTVVCPNCGNKIDF
jgi:hypothetical protein